MAKAVYIGNNNSKKVKKMYLGNGTSHKVKKGYIGVNGVARLFFSGATVWKKYNAVENHTYHWNRFIRVTKTTYKWNRYSITWGTESYTTRDEVYIGSNSVYGDRVSYPYPVVDGLFDVGSDDLSSNITNGVERIANASRTICCTRTNYRDGYFRLSGGRVSVYHETMTVYTPVETQGELIDTITASSPDAYPTNGVSGNYWYVAAGSDVTYSKGTAVGEVTSSNRGAYPDNNYSGNYWYVFARDEITYTRGSYIQDIENDNPNAYPENGRHTDGYWYVKQ